MKDRPDDTPSMFIHEGPLIGPCKWRPHFVDRIQMLSFVMPKRKKNVTLSYSFFLIFQLYTHSHSHMQGALPHDSNSCPSICGLLFRVVDQPLELAWIHLYRILSSVPKIQNGGRIWLSHHSSMFVTRCHLSFSFKIFYFYCFR